MNGECKHGDWEVELSPFQWNPSTPVMVDRIKVLFRCPHCGYEQCHALDAPRIWFKRVDN